MLLVVSVTPLVFLLYPPLLIWAAPWEFLSPEDLVAGFHLFV